MKYGSVCSGIEAATVAWHPLGWEAAWYSEIEPFPCAVLKHHYPSVPNWGDMTKFQEWPDEPIDLLVGGTPCQSFSVAGLRKGLDDPRGNLMLTYLAIADRHRPEWLVWENVPGVLSSNGGRDFASLLRGLGELGYGWAYRVLDAQYFGVAQRRRRVFVVANSRGWQRAAAVLFERHSLQGHPAPSRETRQGVARNAADGAAVGISDTVDALTDGAHMGGGLTGKTPIQGAYLPCVANPLTARMHKGINTTLDEGQTPIVTPGAGFNAAHAFDARQSDVIQYGDKTGPLDTDGHSVAVVQPLNFYGGNKRADRPEGGFYVKAEETSKTLDAASGLNPTCSQGGTAVMQPVTTFAKTHKPMSATDAEGWSPVEAAPTVTHWPRDRSDAGTDVAVVQPVAFSRNDDGGDATEDCAPTMRVAGRAGGMLGVAQSVGSFKPGQSAAARSLGYEAEVAPSLEGGGGGNNKPAIHAAMQVRRLTPVECERLQGFPDNYTNIPWRGKPESPDGPRYKALGNSMAVPVMRWIGERIQQVSDL